MSAGVLEASTAPSPKKGAPRKGASPKSAPAPKSEPAPTKGKKETVKASGIVAPDGYKRAAFLLHQAAEPTRLRILAMLRDADANVGEICVRLENAAQPAISHHLALLRASDLVESRKDGKFSVYTLTDKGRRLFVTVCSIVE